MGKAGWTKLLENVYQIKPGPNSSHCYLITAEKTLLVDTGTISDFPQLEKYLMEIGVAPSEIDLIINTHEHFDHFGGNIYFQSHRRVLIGAHRLSAVKMIFGDDEITMCRANDTPVSGYKVHLWLNNTDIIDLGTYTLKVIHTPGHTSGSICLYEPKKKILFSGDTFFALGTISNISKSGSLAEYFNSLRRLKTFKVEIVLPGHGKISTDVEKDLSLAINRVISQFPEAKNVLDWVMSQYEL